jgi:hypothetical protein
MEGLTRLVSESLARHGFDRPVDYRRLSWSRWFRCESHHSLLFVPSKPGVFAVAEEIMDWGNNNGRLDTTASQDQSAVEERRSSPASLVEERRFSAASGSHSSPALAAVGISPDAGHRKPEAVSPRRMLAVTQFFEDEDMAFVLDRMLSRQNPMAARLATGRYFVRFVVVEDQTQRRSICSALNQWMVSATEKATGIGSHFASSLELTPATEYVPPVDDRQQTLFAATEPNVGATTAHVATAASAVPRTLSEAKGSGMVEERRFSAAANVPQKPAASAAVGRRMPASSSPVPTAPHLDSGAATNIHCPSPFPSGF